MSNGLRRQSRLLLDPLDVDLQYAVPSAYISNVGVQTATTGWGTVATLTVGQSISFQGLILPPVANAINTPPVISAVTVEQVHGNMGFIFGSTGAYRVSVGIYVSKYDTRTGTWMVQQPSVPADAIRNTWHFLETINYEVNATPADPYSFKIDLQIPRHFRLHNGEALHVAIDNSGNNPGSLFVYPCFRVGFRDIA